MSIEKLICFLRVIERNIDQKDLELINQVFKSHKCKKNEILISNNQICDKIFFVSKGILRAFYIDEKGSEKTRLISDENMFCCNWASFCNLSDNNEFIQSLEKSEILYITHQNFYELINHSPYLSRIYIKILEESQVYNIRRFEFISNLTLQERLEYIEKYFPNIQHRISNRVLASFLHTTPEHCSTVKKTIAHKFLPQGF